MSVTGYLSLYTTLLGWQLYDNLWSIMVDTGLIYLPFAAIFLNAVIPPFLSMGAKDAAVIATRRLFTATLTALAILFVAGMPSVTLSPTVLHFQPACTDSSKDVNPGQTQTTYDNAFPAPSSVTVPVWWYWVMQVSNGVNDAAVASLSCKPIQFRALHNTLDISRIHDPQLQQEVSQFYQQCYLPAYSTYLDNSQWDDTQQAQVQTTLSRFGKQDVGWLGSQTFLTVSGFYDKHRAASPVMDFPFDASRDSEAGQVSNHSPWGEPQCTDWWQDSQHGLYMKLKAALPPSFTDEIAHMSTDKTVLEQAAVKKLIINSSPHSFKGYESLEDDQSGGYASDVGEYLGASFEKLSFYPQNKLLVNSLPIIQAILLFAVYMLLAILLPFAKYSVKFCVAASFFLFSLTLCSFLWHSVMWLDNVLMESLYGISGSMNSWQVWFDKIVALLYLGLPLVLTSMGTWAGIAAGSALSQMAGGADSGASQAAGRVSSMATKRLGL